MEEKKEQRRRLMRLSHEAGMDDIIANLSWRLPAEMVDTPEWQRAIAEARESAAKEFEDYIF